MPKQEENSTVNCSRSIITFQLIMVILMFIWLYFVARFSFDKTSLHEWEKTYLIILDYFQYSVGFIYNFYTYVHKWCGLIFSYVSHMVFIIYIISSFVKLSWITFTLFQFFGPAYIREELDCPQEFGTSLLKKIDLKGFFKNSIDISIYWKHFVWF